MIRILFVDDEPAVLQGLENRLRSMRGQWDMHFANSGNEALGKLAARTFDIVVSDMRMPGIDGAELLTQVRDLYPRVARVILTGDPGKDSSLRVLPVAQQILSKPCEASTLQRAVKDCTWLDQGSKEPGVLEAVSAVKKLPALPRLYWELVSEIDNPRADSTSVARIIEQDIAMTARVLQVVNSAYFAPGRKLRHIREAVTYLGVLPMRSMVLAMQMFQAMSDICTPPGFSLQKLQAHSLRTAQIASGLVKDAAERQTAFAAGMLHDVGKLVMAVGMQDRCVEVMVRAAVQHESMLQAERAVLGCTHAEIGAHLLSLWALPPALVDAVAFHHAPGQLRPLRFGAAGAVHVANALAHDDLRGAADAEEESVLDVEYLRAVGVPDSLEAWRDQVVELFQD